MSIEIGYHRRSFDGFSVNDNLALTNADLTPYTVTAPSDSRLPNGGGYSIGTLYDVVPAKFGQVDNLRSEERRVGEEGDARGARGSCEDEEPLSRTAERVDDT